VIADVHAIPEEDLALLGKCVRAAAYGPFFPDVEMHALLGADRPEVQSISDDWPHSLSLPEVDWIVQNVLANLTGYPIDEPDRWGTFIDITEDEVRELSRRFETFLS
jgi:hypothetical protein